MNWAERLLALAQAVSAVVVWVFNDSIDRYLLVDHSVPATCRNRAAAMYSLIVTAKINDIDSRAWLADVLARNAGHPAFRLDDLLPWNWIAAKVYAQAA